MPVSYLETGVLYCADNLRQLAQFPEECVDLIYLDPPFFPIVRTRSFGVMRRRSDPLRIGGMAASRYTSTGCGSELWRCTVF